MKTLVFIINGSNEYKRMFELAGFGITNNIHDAGLVCFTGGADVTPSLYGDKQHKYTGNNPERDAHEAHFFTMAQELGIPCVGICRGGQFLNVMSGGRMYQHVEEHCGDHDLIDSETGETIRVTSTHHQMFMPSDKATILAIANLQGTREWYDGQVFKRDVSNTDYEVVFYEHTRSLCFQPHPEFRSYEESRMRSWFFELVSKHLGV